jgi:hypothetical protein
MATELTAVLAKGVSFLYARTYIEEKYGRDTWERVMQSMPPGSREVWSSYLLVTQEYPFAAFKDMMSALNGALKAAKEEELAAIYEYIADQSLNKMYKIFFRLAHPSFVIRNYPKLWRMFFSAGTVEVPVAEKGHAIVRFLLPEIFNDWLTPACLGYSKKAVEMAGGSGLTADRVSRGKKDEDLWETVYELRWKE